MLSQIKNSLTKSIPGALGKGLHELGRQVIIHASYAEYSKMYNKVEKWILEYGINKSKVEIKDSHEGLGKGLHFAKFDNAILVINKTAQPVGDYIYSNIEIDFLSTSKDILDRFNKEVDSLYSDSNNTLSVYSGIPDGWRWVSGVRKRGMDSVYLPQEKLNYLLKDLEHFWKSGKWYEECGIPYRRGYLFHGVPGTGKSSLASAIAGHLDLPIYCLSCGSHSINDAQLTTLLTRINSDRYVLLIEDIDESFKMLENKPNETNLATLLNLLDGVLAGSGRILILSTNNPEKLPPALLRPGRVDVQIHFDYIRGPEAIRMFERCLETVLDSLQRKTLVDFIKTKNISPAELQVYLMEYRGNVNGAISHLQEINSKHEEKTSD